MPASIANYTTPSDQDLGLLATAFQKRPRIYASPSLSVISVNSMGRPNVLNGHIFKLINQFLTLEHNWDGDDAKAPSENALDSVLDISRKLSRIGQPIYHAAPGPNGEVMIDLRNADTERSVELVFFADKAVGVFFPKEEQPFQTQFDMGDLPSVLEWLNKP